MTEEIEGCVHLIVKNGKIVNVYTHISKFPKDGVVHLKGHKIYSFEEFKDSHILDHKELEGEEGKIVISSYELPSNYKELKEEYLKKKK